MEEMKDQVAEQLFDLNCLFYQSFGRAFAETRRRIQPGVRRVLREWAANGHWLDLGCGSGVLAVEWLRAGFQGSYLGVDFSQPLLEEANRNLAAFALPHDLNIRFEYADLRSDTWVEILHGVLLDGAMMFSVLHHIPGAENRLQILKNVHRSLKPGGMFIHSEWQFQNSPKLMSRIKPWSLAGIDPTELEEGDTLLDWRHAAAGQEENQGLRYVHLFSRQELEQLAGDAGFNIEQEFVSDGAGERLGLYQLWLKC
jgi:SAM-dependent methyltransferase